MSSALTNVFVYGCLDENTKAESVISFATSTRRPRVRKRVTITYWGLDKTTLAATEFVRLQEASGSVTAKPTNETSEKRHKLFQRRVKCPGINQRIFYNTVPYAVHVWTDAVKKTKKTNKRNHTFTNFNGHALTKPKLIDFTSICVH